MPEESNKLLELQGKVESLEAENEQLTEQLAEAATPDGIVSNINNLSDSDKRDLAHHARTDAEGIKAFQAINFGF